MAAGKGQSLAQATKQFDTAKTTKKKRFSTFGVKNAVPTDELAEAQNDVRSLESMIEQHESEHKAVVDDAQYVIYSFINFLNGLFGRMCLVLC